MHETFFIHNFTICKKGLLGKLRQIARSGVTGDGSRPFDRPDHLGGLERYQKIVPHLCATRDRGYSAAGDHRACLLLVPNVSLVNRLPVGQFVTRVRSARRILAPVGFLPLSVSEQLRWDELSRGTTNSRRSLRSRGAARAREHVREGVKSAIFTRAEHEALRLRAKKKKRQKKTSNQRNGRENTIAQRISLVRGEPC